MRRKYFLFLAVFVLNACTTKTKDISMNNIWFQSRLYTKIVIKEYKSLAEQKVTHEVVIDDPAIISFLKSRIEHLPNDGKMMISFGPEASRITLDFLTEKGESEILDIYEGHIKNPTTGFTEPRSSEEKNLVADINNILSPVFKKPLLKSRGTEYRFQNFSITYLERMTKAESQISLATNVDHFRLKDGKGAEQVLEVRSGQTPPQPFEFEVNGRKYTLLTYEAETDLRLYPHYFQILKH